MVSKWEFILNKNPTKIGGKILNLSSILNSIDKKEKIFDLNSNYSTIRYIEKSEYNQDIYKYVEPNFCEVSSLNLNAPKFILFSAPGATGKSALAKHVCYTKNGIYWDLPDNKVAEYSFQGAITEAVGFSNISPFIEKLIKGDIFLVIDAFDEAETGSGRTGIEFFLRDLNNVTNNSNNICAILLARTESAIFIKKYFIENKISFNHFEVGYFAEYNAKTYIKNGLEKMHIPITNIVNTCIDEQFKEIKRILLDTKTDAFLGYAPVLNALTTSYDNDRNTLNLLKNTINTENNCDLLNTILNDLLKRECEKFIKALKIKIPRLKVYSESVYDVNEQLFRIFGIILFNDSTLFAEIDKSIPVEFHEEYLEAINTQLPQHPFIQPKENNLNLHYDFSGTAFRDFVIAYVLSHNETCDFVDEYINIEKKYCPSQMLIEFYSIFSKKMIKGKYIPLMYNSYKAHAQFGDKVSVYINGNTTDCSIEFILDREGKNILPIEFNIVDLENGIYINQLSNCYIDIEGIVYIGNISSEARIYNSVIDCNEIIWQSEHILVEAYSPGECILTANKFNYTTNTLPRFEIKTDDKDNLKVYCSTLSGYFKLLPYKCNEISETTNDIFTLFSNLLRRIFSCLRSHSKDTPARKMDFIDNRIISTNETKKKILQFLLNKHILYIDEQAWLYKLDTKKLSEFSINWNEVRDGQFDSLKNLYNIFKNTRIESA